MLDAYECPFAPDYEGRKALRVLTACVTVGAAGWWIWSPAEHCKVCFADFYCSGSESFKGLTYLVRRLLHRAWKTCDLGIGAGFEGL